MFGLSKLLTVFCSFKIHRIDLIHWIRRPVPVLKVRKELDASNILKITIPSNPWDSQLTDIWQCLPKVNWTWASVLSVLLPLQLRFNWTECYLYSIDRTVRSEFNTILTRVKIHWLLTSWKLIYSMYLNHEFILHFRSVQYLAKFVRRPDHLSSLDGTLPVSCPEQYNRRSFYENRLSRIIDLDLLSFH